MKVTTIDCPSPPSPLSWARPSWARPGVLRAHVEALAKPRDFYIEARQNRRTRERIADLLNQAGYQVEIAGRFKNVVATPKAPSRSKIRRPIPLVVAHLDSVPGSPGADDNASGLAVLLETAREAAKRGLRVAFLAPNAEEHGFLGSYEFVESHRQQPRFDLGVAHVLEMLGFASSAANSQKPPLKLPLRLPTVGDFVGLAANGNSASHLKRVLRTAKNSQSAPRVVALRTYCGMEKLVPALHRSDHVPFWQAGLPSIMWTDTADFRNRHYHKESDTPDTLDYDFMARVATLLLDSIENA